MRTFLFGRASVLAGLVFAFVFWESLLPAAVVTIGTVRAEIVARNSSMLVIPQARVVPRAGEHSIRFTISAPGYVTAEILVPTGWGPGEAIFRDVVLDDTPKRFFVLDFDGRSLDSVFLDLAQDGFPSDRFGLTLLVPQKTWVQPRPNGVMVVDPVFNAPLTSGSEITTEEEFFRVRLSIPRRVLDMTGSNYLVCVDTEAEASASHLLMGTPDKTCTFPGGEFPWDIRKRFERLHQNPREAGLRALPLFPGWYHAGPARGLEDYPPGR